MASSGQVTLSTQSVDYPCCPWGRGHAQLTNIIGWTVDNNNDISFTLIDSYDNMGGSWFVCKRSTSPGYDIELVPQVSYDGGVSWENLDVKSEFVGGNCGSGNETNTITMSTTLINSLGSYRLRGNCRLRFLYYITVPPNPDASYPNAFPDSSYSEAVQVPVDIEVSWEAKINYDSNGGSAVPATTVTTTDETATLTITNTVPTRTNYRFNGWSYGGDLYHGGDTIVIQKSNPTIVLVAQWDEYYRPGATLSADNGAWLSHNRTNKAAHILADPNSTRWKEMRTIDGGTGKGNPPSILRAAGNVWTNQKKLGKNS